MQDKPTVAVLMGGWSAERAVSLNSGRAVSTALEQAGFAVHAIDVTVENRLQIGALIKRAGAQLAFIALHGRGGEDGQVQTLLDWEGIPFTGSGAAASAVGMDKALTKRIWQGLGLATADFAVVDSLTAATTAAEEIGYPVVVKPIADGSSFGVHLVEQPETLAPAFADAGAYGRVMVEKCIAGTELTVAVLDNTALPAIAIAPSATHTFYDYQAKYHAEDTQYKLPCGLAVTEEQQLAEQALQAYQAINASGWGRVDFIRDAAGVNWLIEVNTVPGMTDHSLVPKAAAAVGLDFPALCARIVEDAWRRRAG